MSVGRARRTNASRPAAVFRLSTTLRLPRLTALKLGLSPATAPGIWRVESPDGGSILITSAPRSASSIAQNGPAITCVTSRTRIPASAAAVDVIEFDRPNQSTTKTRNTRRYYLPTCSRRRDLVHRDDVLRG